MIGLPTILMVANGDLRQSANETCWPAQADMEARLAAAFARLGARIERAHPYKPALRHGFIASQKEGLEVFAGIDRDAPLVVATAVWQYSQHLLAGLLAHRGPILTVANWSGTYPGLVGLLNLNGSLRKAGVAHASLWSIDFEDAWFTSRLEEWLRTGRISHDLSHVRSGVAITDERALAVAGAIADALRARPALMGVFDEGCMGMYNAIVPDELMFPLGIYKERLSQSSLYHATTQVPEAEARAVFDWLVAKGLDFRFGVDPATELTPDQVLEQCRMYVAAVRMADTFGCETIGIQYQQGLKDLLAASDLVEGLLNNDDRPPVQDGAGAVIRAGQAIPHFNEVDECAGIDGLFTSRVHRALGLPAETTLHDLRWGDADRSGSSGDYVWVFEISGAAPPAHHQGGYAGSQVMRQPAMFFRRGGGTLRGVARPGEIVWSRIFVEGGKLHMDIGRGRAIALPEAETERRWRLTNPEWPIMHAVLYGISRDQMMARHRANHIQVAYGDDAASADTAMYAKAALADRLGIAVAFCGTRAAGAAF